MTTETSLYKAAFRVALVSLGVLLVPLAAMQFTDEMNWGAMDFVLAGALLFGAGFTYQVLVKSRRSRVYRLAMAVAVATLVMLIVANLAVGIIGDEGNGANLLYAAVLLAAMAGSALAGFRPRGMARAMFGAAAVQALATGVAFYAGWVDSGAAGVLLGNTFFIALFGISGYWFHRAALEQNSE
jgi:hypothetical protein